MDPNLTQKQVEIRISGTQIFDQKFKKIVIYSISGSDYQGSFQVNRRYKEFNSLRNILACHWPGCYIPMIPGKKLIVNPNQGNLQADFIDQRKKLLEIFLVKITETIIYSSEEFQLFIRGPDDFIKSLGTLKRLNLSEIAEKYSTIFSINPGENIEESIVQDSEAYLKLTLSKLEAFEQICKKNMMNYEVSTKSVEESLRSLNGINESYKKYGKDFGTIMTRFEYLNPFKNVLEWARAEILDFEAILFIIQQRNDIEKIKIKTQEKIENEQRSLSKVQSGKKSLTQMLSGKSDNEKITQIDKNIQDLLKEQETQKFIEQVITQNLIKNYLPDFKMEKSRLFSEVLKHFSESFLLESDFLFAQSKDIMNIYS